eukprot:TCONS_00007779-protein
MLNNTTTQSTSIPNQQQNDHQIHIIDYIITIIYVFVLLIGVIGNLMVCLYFRLENTRLKHLQTLIFYLAFSDLCASFTNPILFIYLQLTHNREWHFGIIGCKLFPLTWRVFSSISCGIIMVINIDRGIALKMPFRDPPKKKHVRWLVAGIALIAVLMETPYLAFSEVVPYKGAYACRVPRVSVPEYGYPKLIISLFRVCLYLSVFMATSIIIRRELYEKESLQSMFQKQLRHHENNHVMKMLFMVALVFIVTVFPRELFHIIYTISWLMHKNAGIMVNPTLVYLNSFFTCLLCSNTFCNVLIYAKLHHKFRKTVLSSFTTSFGMSRNNNCEISNKRSKMLCWKEEKNVTNV